MVWRAEEITGFSNAADQIPSDARVLKEDKITWSQTAGTPVLHAFESGRNYMVLKPAVNTLVDEVCLGSKRNYTVLKP